MAISKITSGGQTGVDRAALDTALTLGLECGGWCPRGRRAEDGPIPDRYPLVETPTGRYSQRTAWNVRDSDATLILTRGRPKRGTALTIRWANRIHKPCLVVDLAADADPSIGRAWTREHGIRVLNVAGPRESETPGIYEQAQKWLRQFLEACRVA